MSGQRSRRESWVHRRGRRGRVMLLRLGMAIPSIRHDHHRSRFPLTFPQHTSRTCCIPPFRMHHLSLLPFVRTCTPPLQHRRPVVLHPLPHRVARALVLGGQQRVPIIRQSHRVWWYRLERGTPPPRVGTKDPLFRTRECTTLPLTPLHQHRCHSYTTLKLPVQHRHRSPNRCTRIRIGQRRRNTGQIPSLRFFILLHTSIHLHPDALFAFCTCLDLTFHDPSSQ